METITCPRCGFTAEATTEYPRLYVTTHGNTPGAIVHRMGATNDHVTLPGKCAGWLPVETPRGVGDSHNTQTGDNHGTA